MDDVVEDGLLVGGGRGEGSVALDVALGMLLMSSPGSGSIHEGTDRIEGALDLDVGGAGVLSDMLLPSVDMLERVDIRDGLVGALQCGTSSMSGTS